MVSILEGAIQGFPDTYWACDWCIEKNRAIAGRLELQYVNGFAHPFVAYYDREFKCATCSEKFIFSKEEQQFWYEELKFITWSVPKNCARCRAAQRKPRVRNTKISALVKNLEKDNLDQLEQLIDLYLEIDKVEKAKYYLAMAKKNTKVKTDNVIAERLVTIKERIAAHGE